MCGLSVIINILNKQVSTDLMKKITDIIKHRGPDGEGYYYGKNVAFGHRRLAIIDLEERANQPFEGPDGLVMTYNGEIYNYLELQDELKSLGYTFKTKSDTEVLLAAYHCWRVDFLRKLMTYISTRLKIKLVRYNVFFCRLDCIQRRKALYKIAF
ncbi:MAG: hypothetical protein VW378_05195 [bacterium]